jgi:hypothetical protein
LNGDIAMNAFVASESTQPIRPTAGYPVHLIPLQQSQWRPAQLTDGFLHIGTGDAAAEHVRNALNTNSARKAACTTQMSPAPYAVRLRTHLPINRKRGEIWHMVAQPLALGISTPGLPFHRRRGRTAEEVDASAAQAGINYG